MLNAEHKKVIERLETLVTKRFKSIEAINAFLHDVCGVQCPVVDKTRYEDESESDFCLIGNLSTNEAYCDFDLYYLKDNGNRYLITEVGYEFE